MARRSREQWFELFKEFEQSELLASEFCRERNLCPRYFSKRKKQLGSGEQQKSVASQLVKITCAKPIAAIPEMVSLQHGDTKMTIPVSQSPQWIASLVKALAQ